MPKAAVKAAKAKPDLQPVFDALRPVFAKQEKDMTLLVNQPGKYYLVSRTMFHNKKPVWFGGLEIKKNYVSVHMVPVYMYAELNDAISPELKKRKQGKGCFNFDKLPAPELLAELTRLCDTGAKFFSENKPGTMKCD
jgi:hypothetical protein